MNKEKKNKNGKIFLILMLGYLTIFVIMLIISIFINIPFFINYGYLFIIIPCIIYLFIIIFCPNILINLHPVKYKYNFDFKNYDEFIKYLDDNMKKNNLIKYKENKDKVVLYSGTMNGGHWRENYIVFHFDSIQGTAQNVVAELSKKLTSMAKNQKDIWRCMYHYIYFICVEKENKLFHEIINTQWTSDEDIICLAQFVGCSFEKKTLYFSEPKFIYGDDNLFLLRRVKKILKLKRKDKIK